MSDCEKQLTELVAVNNVKHFRGKGILLLRPGWRSAHSLSSFQLAGTNIDHAKEEDRNYAAAEHLSSEDDTREEHLSNNFSLIASKLNKNDILKCLLPAEVKRELTKPPGLLTDSSLLYLMERAGNYSNKLGDFFHTFCSPFGLLVSYCAIVVQP